MLGKTGAVTAARNVGAGARNLLRDVTRHFETIAERARQEQFDPNAFVEALELEKLADISYPGQSQIVPGIGAAATLFGSMLYLVRPTPHTHVQLRIEEHFYALAKKAAEDYVASDKQGLSPADHFEAGLVLASIGRHMDALLAYEHALRAGPNGLVLCLVGISLACRNRHRAACRACKKSLHLMPDLELARIVLRASKVALKNPHRRLYRPSPLTIVLTMAGFACDECEQPASNSGHVDVRACYAATPLQGGPHPNRGIIFLCYAQGLHHIGLLRRKKLALCALAALELGMLFVDPGIAAQIGAMRPLVEIGAGLGASRVSQKPPNRLKSL